MKRLALGLTMILFAFVSPSYATGYSATGTISFLRSHDQLYYGPDVDWFAIVGVSSLGTCKADGFGNIVFRIRDDTKGQRMFTVLLAAKTSGSTVLVWVDDTFKDSGGYCYALFVQ
jgi:hypothetical protein